MKNKKKTKRPGIGIGEVDSESYPSSKSDSEGGWADT